MTFGSLAREHLAAATFRRAALTAARRIGRGQCSDLPRRGIAWRAGVYLANTGAGVSLRALHRAGVGYKSEKLRAALGDIEDRRDDPEFDALVDQLQQEAFA